jgi:hypothetical protein
LTIEGNSLFVLGSCRHGGGVGFRDNLSQSAAWLCVRSTSVMSGHFAPIPLERGIDRGATACQARVNEDHSYGVRHDEAPHVEVESIGTGNAPGQVYIHGDRFNGCVHYLRIQRLQIRRTFF